jgi:hypothetical protein
MLVVNEQMLWFSAAVSAQVFDNYANFLFFLEMRGARIPASLGYTDG